MGDQRKLEGKKAAARIPFLVACVAAIVAFALTDSVMASIFTLGGFAIGSVPVEKWVFWIDSLEERRQLAKPILLQFTDPELEAINRTVFEGRKVDAIKTIRAKTGAGPKEAKLAVELLEEFGLRWREVLEERV